MDYIIFDGLTEVSDKKKTSIRIVFMDGKKDCGSLSRIQMNSLTDIVHR